MYTASARAFLEVFFDDAGLFLETDFAKAYHLKYDHLDVVAFEAEIDLLPAEDSVTPKFHCHDLTETSCEEPCDWHTAFTLAHDFSDTFVPHASKQRVFVKAAGEGADDFVHTTAFFSFSALWPPQGRKKRVQKGPGREP